MATSHNCSECGQLHIVQDPHKENLNKHKLTMLQTAARHVIQTGVNEFSKKDFMEGHSNYANFPKLRYHGLIFKAQKDGKRIKGRWGITRNGWAFLRGDIELPVFVKVADNEIKERSDRTIHVKDVYRGSEVIETAFEYFDHDTGQPIGIRPTTQTNNQQSLL